MKLRSEIPYYYQPEIRPQWIIHTVEAVKKLFLEQYLLDHPDILNKENHMLHRIYQELLEKDKTIQPTALEQNHFDYVTKAVTEILSKTEPTNDPTKQTTGLDEQFRSYQAIHGRWPGMSTRDYGYLEAFCIEQIKPDEAQVLTPGKLAKIVRPFVKINYDEVETELVTEYYENTFYNLADQPSSNPIPNMIRENKCLSKYRSTEQRSPYLFTIVRNAAFQLAQQQITTQQQLQSSQTLQERETAMRRTRRREVMELLLNERQLLNKNRITNEENILFLLSRKLPYGVKKQPFHLTVLEYYALLDMPPQSLAAWKKNDPQWQPIYKRLVYFERCNSKQLKEINYTQKQIMTQCINNVKITQDVNDLIYQAIDQYGYPRIEGIYNAFCTAYAHGSLKTMDKKQVRSHMIHTLSQVPKGPNYTKK